ncbi:hypothetical protein HYFRA_00013132 [Hymenoscyphus fraxineus]|uniref:2EXR domain-containing protein n=1 Tax=Hymenoscyphus fraxineus TaxID=746836 RepID=A0A9N9L3Z7_9HELO|nr:hypothetical protein HYFRA_00013132 [Hymenoscyphus fraxineus]
MAPSKALRGKSAKSSSHGFLLNNKMTHVSDFFHNELPDPNVQLFDQKNTSEAKFLLFEKLPVELRLNIWDLGCTVPRTIHLIRRVEKMWKEVKYMSKIRNEYTVVQSKWKLQGYLCSAQYPGCLSTNEESRKVAMKHYHPLINIAPSVIYFNPAVDTVRVTFIREGELLRQQTQQLTEYFAKDLSPNASEIMQQLELRNTTWTDNKFLYKASDNTFKNLPTNCYSLSGRIVVLGNNWEHFRNLRRITIFRPKLFLQAYDVRAANEVGGETIRDRIVRDFTELKGKYPEVCVPDILVGSERFTVEHVGDWKKDLESTGSKA